MSIKEFGPKVDTYCLDLARSKMDKAIAELSAAQAYLRDANLPVEIRITQNHIDRIREQTDRLIQECVEMAPESEVE